MKTFTIKLTLSELELLTDCLDDLIDFELKKGGYEDTDLTGVGHIRDKLQSILEGK